MCVVVRSYIDIYIHNNYYIFPTPLLLYSSFFGSSILTSLFILKCFFERVSRARARASPETSTCEVPMTFN